MNMSEFERQENSKEDDAASLSLLGRILPDDFSEEDKAFAQELDTLFALEEEELPPYFAQTLLEPDDPRFQVAEHGFEHKIRARVFRRLQLRRRLFPHERPGLRILASEIPVRRSLAVSFALVMIICLTVLFTAPSFASGLELLLKGARTGVLKVHSYPKNVTNVVANIEKSNATSQTTMSLSAAEQQLHSWHIYWPQALPQGYTLTGVYLYRERHQNWTDGPFIELDYALTGMTPQGTGQLAIREFKLKPDVKVLQVVNDGSAQAINVDQNGLAQEIYVNGQWVVSTIHNEPFPVWKTGQRSELIYQQNGIVFWIVGDLRDGINQAVLQNIAASLQPLPVGRTMHMGLEDDMDLVTLRYGEVNGPFSGDVIAVYPFGSITPYLTLIGVEQTPAGKPVPASQTPHPH